MAGWRRHSATAATGTGSIRVFQNPSALFLISCAPRPVLSDQPKDGPFRGNQSHVSQQPNATIDVRHDLAFQNKCPQRLVSSADGLDSDRLRPSLVRGNSVRSGGPQH
ncbi:hypothetical protein BO71DRAFT_406636 [Aspergillus ellipticus CBS 707.79]|uniref:Uncharacterized protein n=1 Tax=Aspergillus ellipticus CBS 707.79 TaxID=1448320 RepID=A0A319DM98_9EURO|nr:hypothetical protein BO71DRAFT_406636 [Aspergillus ellipticus CBS 707.79]